MKKEFKEVIIEIINVGNNDIISTSNEAYVSWWEQDQNDGKSEN